MKYLKLMGYIMKTLSGVSQEYVQSLLDYDPATGIFRWKNRAGMGGRIAAGTQAGNINKEGYRYIWIDGTLYRACRLAWLVTYGKWPDHQIDHINRKTDDDRIENLRDATPKVNSNNRRELRSDNTSGYRGVSFDKDREKWVAHVSLGKGKKKRIGRFDSAEAAAKALREYG